MKKIVRVSIVLMGLYITIERLAAAPLSSVHSSAKSSALYAAGISALVAGTFGLWKGIAFLMTPSYAYLKMNVTLDESILNAWNERKKLFPEIYENFYGMPRDVRRNLYEAASLLYEEENTSKKKYGSVVYVLEVAVADHELTADIQNYAEIQRKKRSYISALWNTRIWNNGLNPEYTTLKKRVNELLAFLRRFKEKLKDDSKKQLINIDDEIQIIEKIKTRIDDLLLSREWEKNLTKPPKQLLIIEKKEYYRKPVEDIKGSSTVIQTTTLPEPVEPALPEVPLDPKTINQLKKQQEDLEKQYASLTASKKTPDKDENIKKIPAHIAEIEKKLKKGTQPLK